MRPWVFALSAAVALGASDAAAQDRFALQLFHFNVQYVCGGTVGFTVKPNPELELDNDTIEDRIITESLAPVIELFAAHPTWGVDIEMQAYMLDVIALRHPELLELMRAMAQTGQIDVVSFHYSDQLFIGYPEEDWARSQALTEATFAAHDVPLSRTVFCQEGQAAAAMAPQMAARGYRNMVWPKNLWIYQHGDFEAEPLYDFGDVFLVAGSKPVSHPELEVVWTFLDDGELLATGDLNPYFPDVFFEDPEAVAAYEAELAELEAQGYRIATVDQYVSAALSKVEPSALPPLLDGTWQPATTTGVKRWMGGAGLWREQERDNHVRTLGAQAHRELVAAEAAAEAAGLEAREALDAAWRMLFLGQVTDASGINPFRGEIQYGLSHMSEALRIARQVIVDAKAELGMSEVIIDPASGGVSAGTEAPFGPGEPAEAPVAISVEAVDRGATAHWERLGEGHHRLTLEVTPGDGDEISVRFEGPLEETLALGLALNDEQVTTIQRSEFDFELFHFALPTGWIGIGQGRFVIKDMGQVHLAAEVTRESGGVTFVDETPAVDEPHRWVFHVIEGTPEDAAALALALNVERRLVR